MDWQGQKLSEQLMQGVLLVSALVSFAVGYLTQSHKNMVLIFLAGTTLAGVLSLPAWRYFSLNPMPWLPPRPPRGTDAAAAATATATATKKKDKVATGAGKKR